MDPDPWQADILRSDAPRILLNCSRQSGKSTTAAIVAVHTALYAPASLVLLVSPSLNQSGELFKKAANAYQALGKPVPAVSQTALRLHLENGSRIVSLPGKEGTIRGFSGVRLLVIDEAAWVPNDLYIALRPMLAVSGGRLLAMSTPHGKRGWFWDAWSGPEAWARVEVPATACPRIAPEFLAEERRSMGDWWYEQEYGCVFKEAQTQAFAAADVERAFDAEMPTWGLLAR